MKLLLAVFLILTFENGFSQSVEVEFDKNRDYTHYKTFSIGESQITTPADQKRVPDSLMNKWVKNAVSKELNYIGLEKGDSTANLIVSYVQGTLGRSDSESIGPLGFTPGSNPDRNFNYEYRQASLIIDLTDRHNNLIWRINSTTNTASSLNEALINGIVRRGLKKFDKLHHKKKKK